MPELILSSTICVHSATRHNIQIISSSSHVYIICCILQYRYIMDYFGNLIAEPPTPAWPSDGKDYSLSEFLCHICKVWYFFVFSPGSRFPFKLFLKQDKHFLKPTADSNLSFNFMISWGMVSDKVIHVSAGWILRVWNISSRLLGCYNKRRWLIENDSCRRLTVFVTPKLLRLVLTSA